MKSIGVLANTRKTEAADALRRLAAQARTLGLTLAAGGETAALLPDLTPVAEDRLPEQIDALLVLGGDGTLLSAVRLLRGRDTPILGINIGSLGFMTSVPQPDLERAVATLAAGRFVLEARQMLECRLRRGDRVEGPWHGLNEIVIGWGASSKMVTLELAVDGEAATDYVCDGMIVSTPTGSTGHSLSAGGPILHPNTAAFVVDVVCPHALGSRPLVIPDQARIDIPVAESSKLLLFAVDGQEQHPLAQGDRLELRRSPRCVRFIHLPGYSYFAVLRQKLHWRGSSL